MIAVDDLLFGNVIQCLPVERKRLLQFLSAWRGKPVFILLGEVWFIAWQSQILLFLESATLGLGYVHCALRHQFAEIPLVRLEGLAASLPGQSNGERTDQHGRPDEGFQYNVAKAALREGLQINSGGGSARVCGRVKQAIRRALGKIERKCPELAAHFAQHLHLRNGHIVYTPAPAVEWET